MVIYAGQTPTSLSLGYSLCARPIVLWCVNPDEETINWRAVCGRTACTVRRVGRWKPSLPLSKRLQSVKLWPFQDFVNRKELLEALCSHEEVPACAGMTVHIVGGSYSCLKLGGA